ncbi:Zn-ribbon containing protein [Natrialbaceae archaeon A-arb3/5]
MPHECTNCGRTFPDGSKEMLSGCPDCGGNKFQFTPSAPESSEAAGGMDTAGGTDTAGAADTAGGTDVAGETTAAEDSSVSTETVDDWVTADSVSRSETPSKPTDSTDRRERPSQLKKTDVSSHEWPDTARRPEDRSGDVNEDNPSEPESDSGPVRTPPSSTWDETEPEPESESSPSDDDATTVPSSLDETEGTAQADARSEVVSSADLPVGSADSSARDDASGDRPAEDDEQPPDHGRVVSEPSDEQPSMEELRAELNEQFESIKILEPGQYELNLMELYNREEYIVSLQEDGRYVIDVPDSWRDDEE